MPDRTQLLPWEGGAPILPVRGSMLERDRARRYVARTAVRLDDRAGGRVVLAALGLDVDSVAEAVS